MATPAHELLKIEAARLKTANDAFMLAQYEAAKLEINKQRASAEQTAAQLRALDAAFVALNTPEKRADYAAAHSAKPPTQAVKTPTRPIKDNNAPKDAVVYIIASENAPAVKEAYSKFIRENYKNAPDYARFRPQEYSFNSLKDFQASPIYNKISANLRDTIIKGPFPCGVLALPFKNQHDADKFRNDMLKKGLIQAEQATSSPRMGRSAGN